MKQFIKLFPILIGLLILPGCATQYKKRSLSCLQQVKPGFKDTQNQITLEVTKLNERQTCSLFDGQGKYLQSINARPLYLRIINDSNHTYYLSPDSITLTRIDNEKINVALSKGITPVLHTLGEGVASMTLFSLILVSISKANVGGAAILFLAPAIIAIGTFALVSLPIVFGSTIYSCYKKNHEVNEYNSNLTDDIAEKNINWNLKIPADTTQEFLFFANAKEFKNNFGVTLIEKTTQKPLTFNVQL